MDRQQINERVEEYYHQHDFNCATTTLRILAEHTGIDLSRQVIDAAVGMHGAGGYGAQCGLVEGSLMFLGILGRERQLADERIAELCHRFAANFATTFSSLLCRELRPEGFADDQPPHLCEGLSRRAIAFSVGFVDRFLVHEGSEPTNHQQSPARGER